MKRFGIGIGLGLVTLTGIASACWIGTYSSVHFHAGQPDFGTLPRRGVLRWQERDVRPLIPDTFDGDIGYVELEPEDYGAQEARETRRTELQTKAFAAIEQGNWKVAADLFQKLGEQTGWLGEWRDLQAASTRMIALSNAEQATLKPAFLRYAATLKAMVTHETVQDAELLALAAASEAGFLREHALYQYAAYHAAIGDYVTARMYYDKFLLEYPKSTQREAVLIMMARGAILPKVKEAQNVGYGKKALAQLEQEFPQSRYKAEIPGLRTRLLVLDNQLPAAFAAYLKRGDLDSTRIVTKELKGKQRDTADVALLAANLHVLTTAKTYAPYDSALREINRLRQTATPAQAKQFSEIARKDPALASDYLYYRLYHTLTKPADLKQLSAFAESVAKGNPNVSFAPNVLTRFAEAAYKEGAYSRAMAWADRSLKAQTTDRALYVRGASRQKLKQTAEATKDFERLISGFAKSPLIPNARENVALLYEAAGRFDKALDTFFALSAGTRRKVEGQETEGLYREDIAYLLDARMSTPQVAAYVRSHGNHPERHLLVYSLGIRYLRDEKWSEAEYWLTRVPQAVFVKFNVGRKEWGEKPSPDPLTAMRELRLRQSKVTDARSGNARAKALYEYASYYSTHGTLLLYNPALWNYSRERNFDYFWNKRVASPDDEKAVRQYMYQHEAYARSRALCKSLTAQYPNAPIVPNALFRQAAATRRLAQFNQWWNRETSRAKLWDDAIQTLNRIAQKYPRLPIAAHARKYAKVFQKERKELAWERQERGNRTLAVTSNTSAGKQP